MTLREEQINVAKFRFRRGGCPLNRLPIGDIARNGDGSPAVAYNRLGSCVDLGFGACGERDRERYERLMELTTRYYGEALDLPPAMA